MHKTLYIKGEVILLVDDHLASPKKGINMRPNESRYSKTQQEYHQTFFYNHTTKIHQTVTFTCHESSTTKSDHTTRTAFTEQDLQKYICGNKNCHEKIFLMRSNEQKKNAARYNNKRALYCPAVTLLRNYN